MPLTEKDLAADRAILQPLIDAEENARRHVQSEPPAKWFLGIAGTQTANIEMTGGFHTLWAKSVPAPPGFVHMFAASHALDGDVAYLAWTANQIRSEVAFETPDEDTAIGLAYHLACLLKLRGFINLWCPGLASRSWLVIPAAERTSVIFRRLDFFPKFMRQDMQFSLGHDDFAWVQSKANAAWDLRNRNISKRFGIALNSFYQWNHQASMELCLSSLWLGLEALFGDKSYMKRVKGSPLTYSDRLAHHISSWIDSAVSADEVRRLYDTRSDVLHGRAVSVQVLHQATVHTEDLLRRALVFTIERGKPPLPDWKSNG